MESHEEVFPFEMDDTNIDHVDAGPMGLHPSERYDSSFSLSSRPSSSSLPAGEVLMSPLPSRKAAGDIITNFNPRTSQKRDSVVTADEVFRSLDCEGVDFKPEGASASVQHFFQNELKIQSRERRKDKVDAGGDYEDQDFTVDYVDTPSPHLPCVGITTEQSRGATPITRTISKVESDFRYKMNQPERGCFVIFNHNNFDLYNKNRKESEHLQHRKGTNKDALNLEHTVKQLGFEYIKVIHDATKSEILLWIQQLSTADHSNYDCFGCAILTHGGDRDVLYARDEAMQLTDFTRPFGADRCVSLARKPKLFFIQACRGVMFDPGKKVKLLSNTLDAVDGPHPSSSGDTVDGVSEREVSIPAEADFLIANSTVPEYYSWRNESNGSFFIQSLCAILNLYGDSMELMQMMTRVNRMVAYDYESSTNDGSSDKKKQIPSIATRLTAEVFFVPKSTPQTYSGIQASVTPPSQTSYMQYDSTVERHTASEDYSERTSFVATTSNAPARQSPSRRQANGQPTAFFPQSTQDKPPLPPKKKLYPDRKARSPPRTRLSSQRITTTPQNSPAQGKFLSPPATGSPTGLAGTPHYIPNRRNLTEGNSYSRSLDSKPLHKSRTEPVNVKNVLPSYHSHARLSEHRHSLPDTKRLVVQDSSNILVVAGRPTSKVFEESDV